MLLVLLVPTVAGNWEVTFVIVALYEIWLPYGHFLATVDGTASLT